MHGCSASAPRSCFRTVAACQQSYWWWCSAQLRRTWPASIYGLVVSMQYRQDERLFSTPVPGTSLLPLLSPQAGAP